MSLIDEEDFKVMHDKEHKLVAIEGVLRLHGLDEYAKITELLAGSLDDETELELNLQKLEFLNSSGIAMLSKFVLSARRKETLKLTIIGSSGIPWQGKSLKNLQRLMPEIDLIIE